MFVRVMNRKNAEQYCYEHYSVKVVMISITDVEYSLAKVHKSNEVIDILRLQFEDVEKGEPLAITDKDAEAVVNFVKRWEDWVSGFIVHCEAGVSRSAGVAAAILKYLTNDDSPIFNNPRYCPNMTCYRAVLNAFYAID